jgi:hypothetical protein
VEGEEEGEADIAAEQAHVHKCHLCS